MPYVVIIAIDNNNFLIKKHIEMKLRYLYCETACLHIVILPNVPIFRSGSWKHCAI
jgi:hypothetical protein